MEKLKFIDSPPHICGAVNFNKYAEDQLRKCIQVLRSETDRLRTAIGAIEHKCLNAGSLYEILEIIKRARKP